MTMFLMDLYGMLLALYKGAVKVSCFFMLRFQGTEGASAPASIQDPIPGRPGPSPSAARPLWIPPMQSFCAIQSARAMLRFRISLPITRLRQNSTRRCRAMRRPQPGRGSSVEVKTENLD